VWPSINLASCKMSDLLSRPARTCFGNFFERSRLQDRRSVNLCCAFFPPPNLLSNLMSSCKLWEQKNSSECSERCFKSFLYCSSSAFVRVNFLLGILNFFETGSSCSDSSEEEPSGSDPALSESASVCVADDWRWVSLSGFAVPKVHEEN
jgi:hypothetical protein